MAALANANTRFATVQSVGQVGGPGLAGVPILFVGAGLAVAVDALSYVVSTVLLLRIRRRAVTRVRGTVSAQARIGLRFLFGSRKLWRHGGVHLCPK